MKHRTSMTSVRDKQERSAKKGRSGRAEIEVAGKLAEEEKEVLKGGKGVLQERGGRQRRAQHRRNWRRGSKWEAGGSST